MNSSTPHLLLALAIALLAALAACSPAAPAPVVVTATATEEPAATATAAPTLPAATATLENWELTWSDEFDGPDGSGIDTTKWTAQTGGEGWGNAELEYYTDRIDNAYIENPGGENGVLVIKAMKEKYKGSSYTSARLKTQDKFEQLYGRFEARIQIPYSQGIWPAFWMLGKEGGWPRCGEIDILENIGKEPAVVHGTVHGPGYYGANGLTSSYSLPGNERFADDFHLYAVEWEPEVIRWYVDNTLYHTLTPADMPEGGEWVFDQPFYMIMNVAVGGGWPGYPDKTTVFPQFMKVDFVRVYARP